MTWPEGMNKKKKKKNQPKLKRQFAESNHKISHFD